jgi:hypothetical protein
MSDLDVERRERQQARESALGDRSFTFGGEKFTHVRDCPWDVIERASALDLAEGINVLSELKALVTELIEPGSEIVLKNEIGKEEYLSLNASDRLQYRATEKEDIWQVYEPNTGRYENHERFALLLRRRQDPITVDDVSALLRWLMGAASGRPTQSPPPSPVGSEASGTPSTETSSPEPAGASKT